MMMDMVKPREPSAVICHGDCWTNNFQFRYADGDIAEVIIYKFFNCIVFLFRFSVWVINLLSKCFTSKF